MRFCGEGTTSVTFNECNEDSTVCIRLRVEIYLQHTRLMNTLNQLPIEGWADCLAGFNSGMAGEKIDYSQSKAWLLGWDAGFLGDFDAPLQVRTPPWPN